MRPMPAVDAGGQTSGPGGGTPERQLPQVFGRYLLLKRLSRGGMGEIFLAKLGEILGFEKLVIIKKILPNLAADQEFIKRFIDEAQVAIKLNHGNVAPVFEVGKVDGEYFLAIEYIEGRDLRRVMARQREERARLPTDLCLYVARELANGLAYAHRRTDDKGQSLALVHCDISPPNVMLSFEGEVKVIDFGIAKSAIRIAGSNPNMGFGKFGYMAPEQLVRGGVVDRRTDVYAAGVVLYELLTGERLFIFPEGADYRQIARMVTAGKIVPPSVRDPRIDPDLDPIVMKALCTQKDDRYQIAEELRDAVQAKLSQLNPTISADALAHYMRGLFKEEITEEHRLVATMKAVDMAPFQEELTQATEQHTVTFARANNLGARIMNRMTPTGSESLRLPTEQQLLAHPRRRFQFFVAAGAAMVLGSALAAYIATRPKEPKITVVAPPPIEKPLKPIVTPVVEPPPPVIVKQPVIVDARPPRQTPKQPKRHVAVQPPVEKPRHSPEEVQAKFSKLKSEYGSFKSQYGSVLEERWNAIFNEITYGKADKFDKVDAMLDALRREMAKVKAGG